MAKIKPTNITVTVESENKITVKIDMEDGAELTFPSSFVDIVRGDCDKRKYFTIRVAPGMAEAARKAQVLN